MRITCPYCAAEYEVPEERLAGRRVLRCAACGQGWAPQEARQEAPEQAPEQARQEAAGEAAGEVPKELGREASDAGPAEIRELAVVRAPVATPVAGVPDRVGLLAAWAGSVVLVGAMLAGGLVAHRPLAHAWPPLQRLYGALGLRD